MKPKDLKHISLLAELASMYYEQDMTQSEIADKLFLSRTRISRLLKQAKEKGIVEIKVNYFFERNYDLEDKFKEKFQLKNVILLNSHNKSGVEIERGIGSLAATYLKQRIRSKMTLGVSWGNTIYETVNSLSVDKKIPIEVVQTMGAASVDNPNIDTGEIIRKLSDIFDGKPYYLNAPLFIRDEHAKETIVGDPMIASTLDKARNADMILTGIGTLSEARSTNPWLGYMNKEMYQEMKQKGAVGCICAQFYDHNGAEIDSKWNRHCIGIRLPNLKKIDEVVAVAGGLDKAKAIEGAIKGNYIHVLISDTNTAKAIMGY